MNLKTQEEAAPSSGAELDGRVERSSSAPPSRLPLTGELGSEVILITGFPQRRARAVLEFLLAREANAAFWLVVPEERRLQAEEFLAAHAANAARIRIFAGEPCAIDFGLSRGEYQELVSGVDRFLALYQTIDPLASRELAERVNVGAAREIVELCRVAERLEHVTFVSSAAVFGDLPGPVAEDAPAQTQGFRTPAEEALARAEALLRRRLDVVPLSIVRTPQILSDRKGGQVAQASGLYAALAELSRAPSDVALPLPPRASATVQVLPADFLAEALHATSVLGTRGRVYHVCELEAPTLESVLSAAAPHFGKRFESSGARVIGRLLLRRPGFWLSQQSGWGRGASETALQSRSGARLLERAGIEVPRLLDYLPAVLAEVDTLVREQRLGRRAPLHPVEAVQ